MQRNKKVYPYSEKKIIRNCPKEKSLWDLLQNLNQLF